MKKVLFTIVAVFLLLSVSFSPAYAETIKAVWDANTEADLAGYKLYQSRTSGGPYTLVQDMEMFR